MNKCIYCKVNDPDSKEHYLPACLGSFHYFESLVHKICTQCNNKFKLLEEQFCRCGPEAFFRLITDIKGRKKHKKPNPFYRGSAGATHIKVKGKHPTQNFDIYFELLRGSKDAYPARQIIFMDSEGEYHPILITEKIKEVKDLKKELNAKRLSDCKPVQYFAAPEERSWIERLCKGFNVAVQWNEMISFEAKTNQEFVAEFNVDDRYFRAIAKIGFHYFLKYFIQFNGIEKEFEGIKDFIVNGGKVEQRVQTSKQFISDLGKGVTPDKYLHVLAVEKNDDQILARAQFFIGPRLIPHSYEIFIGKNPGKLSYRQATAHQFIYFDKPDMQGYNGIMQSVHVINKDLLI